MQSLQIAMDYLRQFISEARLEKVTYFTHMPALLISWLSLYHAFYLSTCYIHIQEDRKWVATMRFFYDDLEDALQNEFQERPNLRSEDPDRHREKMTSYLKKHFRVTLSDQVLQFEIIRMSSLDDIYEIELKGLTPWRSGKCTLENDLLVQVFPGQKNIITIMIRNETLIFDFSKKVRRDEFTCP